VSNTALAAKEDLYEDYVFVSPRHIVQLIECCIRADESLLFDIFYGRSNNDWRWADIENTREQVGYAPQDRFADNHVLSATGFARLG